MVVVKPLRFFANDIRSTTRSITAAGSTLVWIQFNKVLAEVEDQGRLRTLFRSLLAFANSQQITLIIVVESHRAAIARMMRGCAIQRSTFSWCRAGVPVQGAYELLSNAPLADCLCQCGPDVSHSRQASARKAHEVARRAGDALIRRVLSCSPLAASSGQALLVPDSEGESSLDDDVAVPSFPLADPTTSTSPLIPSGSSVGSVGSGNPPDSDARACADAPPGIEKAYPTEGRERQKAKEKAQKESGEEVVSKKRKQNVEQHFDDCGNDLASIESLLSTRCPSEESSETEDDAVSDDFADGLLQFSLWGSGSTGLMMPPVPVCLVSGTTELTTVLHSLGIGQDIIEVNGDSIAVRRLRSNTQSEHFDVVTTTDLSLPEEADNIKRYVAQNDVILAVLTPKSHASGRLCAELADLQLQKDRHFLAEQPITSTVFYEPFWADILQCADVRLQFWNRTPVSSCVVSSHGVLTSTFDGCQSIDDVPYEVPSAVTKPSPWTWEEASRVASGIYLLREACAFPSTAAGPDRAGEPPPAAPEPAADQYTCPACRWRRPKTDPSHTRDPDTCRHPLVEPINWPCPGCRANRPRSHEDHTLEVGNCRWHSAQTRQGAGAPRRGRHPRAGRQRASAEPTAGLGDPALGAGDEARLAPEGAPPPNVQEGGSSSSAAGAAPPAPQPADAEPGARQGRGPDQEPRERRTWAESGVGPETPADWTSFDIGRVLRVLRAGGDASCRRVLRKLHLRWWHASADTMRRLLSNAGLPERVLVLLPDICDTCSVCRKWAHPLPTSVASVNVAESFNLQVELDLMFYRDKVIFHMIDRCTRWHATKEVPSKHTDPMLQAIAEVWVAIHGPPKEIICDGESACKTLDASVYFDRLGIKFIVRAPNQHARFIERRGALLRDVLHKIDSQLQAEGLTGIPFAQRLSEATFAGNALVSVNGSTPYNALYGRVPHLLPDLQAHIGNPDTDRPDAVRGSHRLREIAVQQMVEGTARARVGRALGTKTINPAQMDGYQLGDQVEFFRKPGSKDASGWCGPATICDLTQLSRGTVAVRHHAQVVHVRLADLRRWIGFLCFLRAGGPANPLQKANYVINHHVEQIPSGRVQLLGWVPGETGVWRWSAASSGHTDVLGALYHLAEVGLGFTSCSAFRLGRSVAVLPACPSFPLAVLAFWPAGEPENLGFFECTCDSPVNLRQLVGPNWTSMRFVQFLFLPDDHVHLTRPPLPSHSSDNQEGPEPVRAMGSDPLPTIPEGTEGSDTAPSEPEEFYLIPDLNLDPSAHAGMVEAVALANQYLHSDVESDRSPQMESPDIWDQHLCRSGPISCEVGSSKYEHIPTSYHIIAANVRAGLHPHAYLTCDEDEPVMEFPGVTEKLIHDRPAETRQGEVMTLHFLANGTKKAVIERDTDNLTAQEMVTHRAELAAAMLKELQTWQKFNCFSRKPRAQARNIIDCRWVLKWKHELLPDHSTRRIIRARLTVRGFKDVDASGLASYAGTSQRYSQRIVVSEAAVRRWDIATTDVSKAFLQGVTYQELAEMTGEPLREVNFMLPSGSVPVLQRLEGFESFDPISEVLHCDKPGTGLVDAPRAFSLKLGLVTKGACKLLPSSVDAELCLKHESGQLVAIMAKHVDDLKISGPVRVVEWIVSEIQKVFGDLIVQWHTFTNCGVRHIQDRISKAITLDQEEYIAAMKPIVHDDLKGVSSESLASQPLQELFMSLLGAAAYALLTRPDAAVFIAALQRVSGKCKIIHIKRLNIVVRWMQRFPCRLTYAPFGEKSETHLRIISDSAFRCEDGEGHALKGHLFLRTETTKSAPVRAERNSQCGIEACTASVHVLDYSCKKQRHVCRSTFGAELFAACDGADHGMLLAQILHEIQHGAVSHSVARSLRETGGWSVRMVLAIDAMSVFAAVTATQVKEPAEKALWSHVQYLRELLDTRVLDELWWLDTRDMGSDGLTKGSVERSELQSIMQGTQNLYHTAKRWATARPPNISNEQAHPAWFLTMLRASSWLKY